MQKSKLYILIGLIILITSFIIYKKIDRRNKLNGKTFETTAFVEKIAFHSKKAKTGHRDVIYFYFIKNDTVFHNLKYLKDYESQKRGITLKDGFSIKISSTDYDIWQLNLDNKRDTIWVDKTLYVNQEYNTIIHKNIIE